MIIHEFLRGQNEWINKVNGSIVQAGNCSELGYLYVNVVARRVLTFSRKNDTGNNSIALTSHTLGKLQRGGWKKLPPLFWGQITLTRLRIDVRVEDLCSALSGLRIR